MSKKRKKSSALPTVLGVVIALALIIGIAYFAAIKPLKEKAVDTVAEKAISSVAQQDGVEASKAQEVYNNMSEEDKEVVKDMIEEHADAETVQQAMEYYQDGDTEALKEMASSELSEEEIQQMKELYQKYVAE